MKSINLTNGNAQLDWSFVTDAIGYDPEDFICVFDLDGVLASPLEDLVYRLPERKGERRDLAPIARHYSIEDSLYDLNYLRHMVFQAILLDKNEPIEAGPFASMAAALCKRNKAVFVLSARSAPAAVERAITFLEVSQIRPQETFFVGRVGKGRQLSLLRSHANARHIIYFDDNKRHSRNAFDQKDESIISIHVEWRGHDLMEKARSLYDHTLNWFEGWANEHRSLVAG